MGIRSLSASSISTGTKRSKVWDQSAVVLTNAFESIATATVGAGGQSSISFTSIPSTYKHLQIRFIARDNRTSTDGDAMKMTFNSDTASNYYGQHYLTADGSSIVGLADGVYSNLWIERIPNANSLANVFGSGIIDLLEYTNTNKYKTIRYLSGADVNGAFGTNNIRFASGLWMSTSAISSITITPNVGTLFSQYSQFALYGIKG